MIEEDLIEVSPLLHSARAGDGDHAPGIGRARPRAAFGSGGDEDARLVSRASKVNASRPEPVRRVTCWFVKSTVSSRVVGGTSPSSSPARRARFVAGHEVARPLQPEPHTPFRVAFHARASDSTTTTIAIRRRRRRSLAAIVVTRVARPLRPDAPCESHYAARELKSGRHRERFDDDDERFDDDDERFDDDDERFDDDDDLYSGPSSCVTTVLRRRPSISTP